MTIWRRAAKRDTAEPAIVDALKAAGCKVWRLSTPLDLLVGVNQRLIMLEVKSNNRTDKRQKQQAEDLAYCQRNGLPVYRVQTVEEALQAVGLKH